ncbi:MAG TPA: ABC transporter permease [Blastocatellia bacterium]
MRLKHWSYTIPLRLRSLFRRSQVEQELDEELRYHIERQTEELIAKGMTPEEARYAALRALGGIEQRKEECRDMRRVNLIENTLQDLRYAGRTLRRSPGFTAVAILSLALGIGANTAIFQLLDAVRLRSLPVARPQELAEVRISGGNYGLGISRGINSEITNPLWERIREHQEAFSGIFAWSDAEFSIGRGAEARRVNGLWVSSDFFSVLGVSPMRGRLFTAADDRRGCGPEGVVISYSFWQSHFGGQDSVIGKILTIEEKTFNVIGVTPPEFFGLEVGKRFDVALPICSRADALDRSDFWWLVVMGRLKPGWTLARASESLNNISPGLFEETAPAGYDASAIKIYKNFRLMAAPAGQGVSRWRRNYETSLWLLLGITGLVLLIACANLANLMLARAGAREREIAVRVALGASSRRLIWQMLSESLLLAGAGAALGAGLAQLLSRTLVAFLATEGDALLLDLRLDWRLLAFTTLVAGLTCVIFGLVPALRVSQIEPGAAMKTGGRGLTHRERFSFQRFFVIGQIAVSLALLVGGVLFVRSFRNLISLDAGFRQNGILLAYTDFPRLRLPADRILGFQSNLLEQIRAIRQVESAATTSVTPLSGGSWTQGVRVPGPGGEQQGNSKFTYISPAYFNTMEIPITAGRDFNDFDTSKSRKVMIVNETFVRRFITNANPIGSLARSVAEPNYPETLYEVVGMVKDTKYASLREDPPPIAFVPATQHPAYGPWAGIVIRSSAPLSEVIAEVRRKVGALSPDIDVWFTVFEAQIREGLIRERVMAWLAGSFGVLAAALAMIGLYGVISYMVLRRRNEIGIRMALGASRADIVILILREMAALLLIGLGIGTVISLAAARGADALLFGLAPHDVPTLLASACLLAVVAGLASFLPALRASRVDPMVALRHD